MIDFRRSPSSVIIVCLALMIGILFIRPSQPAFSQTNTTIFKVGKGSVDLQPRQIIRTNDDRVYIFASHGQENRTIYVYYTTTPGLPVSAASFSGFVSFTDPGFPLSVDPVYDGATTIHLFVNNNNGELRNYPFDLTTNTFRSPILIATGNPTVPSGLYVGTNGLSGLAGTDGRIHVAYWSAGNQITYKQFTYSPASNTLTTIETTRLDSDGRSNHPMVAISPLDGSISVAWVSETGTPAHILARTRPNSSGVWGGAEQVSNAPVWRSTNFGINVDQGPNILIDSAGTRHLTYIENFDSTGDYGRVHYAFKRMSDSAWTSTPMAATSAITGLTINGFFYSHTPTLALDATGTLYLFGHGPTLTNRNNEMYYAKRNANGTWGPIELLLAPPSGDSLDASPSVKWSVVGFNRPEVVELLFFLAPGANYYNVDLYYARLGDGQVSTTPTPQSTVTPAPTPIPTVTGSPNTGGRILPSGFSDELVVGGLLAPRAFAFLPDGRILILERGTASSNDQNLASIRVFKNGSLLTTRAYSVNTCGDSERGLLGIAADPAFASNGYIYVYYTRQSTIGSACGYNTYSNGAPDGPRNRVSRLTMQGDGVIAGSERVLIDNIVTDVGYHNAGDIHFDLDGFLYIVTGDGGISNLAQSNANLNGKVLRILPDSGATGGYTTPGNPFDTASGSRYCGLVPQPGGTGPCREVFATGLRNPFRFSILPNVAGISGAGQPIIGDVGGGVWEEISLVG